MVASSVTIRAPGGTLPNTIVRPSIQVEWAGGVGPFDVEYTWDTDPTFGNGGGNRQQVTNTSVTSRDLGVPTADLAVLTSGTVWYLRATVIDQGDAGASLSDSDNSFTYFDPLESQRYLYLLANVGVAFEPDDRPLEKQIVANTATSGTFTLSLDGVGPTTTIAYNATKAALKAAIEGLSNVTEVEVYQLSPQSWWVKFVDTTADPIPAMTADSTGLTGGTASVSVEVDDASPWGTGGTVGADGANIDANRYLYALANVGVGFEYDRPPGGWGTGGTAAPDGDNRDSFSRYLYLLANVDSTQPCPFIFDLSINLADAGDTLTLTGQGLVSDSSPTADSWGAEVRLYESQSLAAAYTVMTLNSWTAGETQDTITFTIPGGSTSGFIAVVHTAGTPSCAGSNFKALTVVAVQPDRQAGWWTEVWSLRNDTPTVRPLADVAEADFEHIPNDVGRGSITLPGSHPDISDILDRSASPPVQKLVKVYLHDRFAYAFIPEDMSEPYVEDGARRVRLYGEGQEGILRWGRVLWRDYPTLPSSTATWKFGSLDEAVEWGDFDPASAIQNGGLEDAQVSPWVPVGTSTLFATTSVQRTGSYSLEVTPAALNDGAEVEFAVTSGQRAFIDVYLKDPAALGGTYLVEVLDDVGAQVASATPVLSSAPWAIQNLNFVPASTYTARLRITQTAGTLTPVYVDDAAAYVDIGTDELELSRCTVGLSRDYAAGGLHSLELAADAGGDVTFNGFVATPTVQAGEDYTLGFFVTGPVGATVRAQLRLNGVLSQVDQVLTGVPTFDKVNVSGTAGPTETTGRFAISVLESAATTVWIDELTLQPGQPAATAGDIVGQVLTAMQARGTLTFVTTSFTATNDTNGNPWPEVLRLELRPDWTLWDVCEKLIGLGYDAELVPQNWRAGGDTGWVLNLYGPLGAGTNWDGVSDGPVLLPGDTVQDAQPANSAPPTTVVFGEGAEGQWTVTAASSAILTALERREDFVRNRAAIDPVTLARVTGHRLDLSLTRGAQVSADLTDNADPLPYLDFAPYDRLRAHLPTDGTRDQVADAIYRVAAVTVRLSGGGRSQQYRVDLGRYQLHAARLRDMILSRNLLRQPTELYQPGAGSISSDLFQ